MKKIVLITAMLLIPLGLSAQTKSFRDFYGRYSGKDGYTTIEMSGEMFNAMGSNVTVKTGKGGDTSKMFKQIKNMIIIISEEENETFRKEVISMVDKGGYTPMTTVRDGDSTSHFYTIKNKNGKVSEFLMTVTGKGDNIIMCIVGDDLDISQISQFAKSTAGKN